MKLTSLQKILWGLVGVAAATVMAFQIWGTDPTEVAATQDTAFKAVFELTDNTGMIRTQDDFAG
ncbi:MAG: SCO family protein, partial [Alphaproteobacteria bacterium]|nr:SCO family protein [Alphaproteobacteria bacterium]